MPRHRFYLALVFLLLAPSLLGSLHAGEELRVGLALSGGGAKGLAHIGVLKVLEEERIPVHVVTGTSMGSIVGGLYAAGYSASQIESVAYAIAWGDMFEDRPQRPLMAVDQKRWEERYISSFSIREGSVTLPSGLITGQRIGLQLAEATIPAHGQHDFLKLTRPFVCIATDLESGKAVILDSGDLGDAIRASMAIPTVFSPAQKEEKILVDGGVVRNLPVEDAVRLGASFVVGVDVSDPPVGKDQLGTLTDVLNQVMNISMQPSTDRQRGLAGLVIRPDVSGISILGFEDIADIISRGEVAARKALPRLRNLIDSLGIPSADPVAPVVIPDTVDIESVGVEGLALLGQSTVLLALPFEVPGRLTRAALRDAMERLYSTGLFKAVDYRIVPAERRLRIRVQEEDETLLRLGFRYDSQNEASVLAGLRLWNVWTESAYLNLEFQAGTRFEGDAEYVRPIGLYRFSGLRAGLNASQSLLNIYADGNRVAVARVRLARTSVEVGTLFSRMLRVSVGARGEYASISEEISALPIKEDYWVGTLTGMIGVDTKDRAVLPRRGVRAYGVLDVGRSELRPRHTFVRWFGVMDGALSISRRWTGTCEALLGTSHGSELPSHYVFRLGGVRRPVAEPYRHTSRVTFTGFDAQELVGRQVQALGVGLRYGFTESISASLHANVGVTSTAEGIKLSGMVYERGAGLTLTYDSLIGPLEFSLMTGGTHPVVGYLSLGYDF